MSRSIKHSEELKDRNLLVISHGYYAFTKDQIEFASNRFKHVYVLPRHNILAEIASYLMPWGGFKHFRKSFRINVEDKPKNVTVLPTPIMYWPLSWGYRRLGDKHFRTVEEVIEKFDLQFDIIHAHFSWSAGYVGAKLKEKYDLPLVITVYENQKWFIEEYESGNEDLYWAWETADTLLRLNQADIPLLERFNSSVVHMPIGYDSAKFYPIERAKARKHLSLPSDKEILFSLGFLKEKKGFRFLIDAMSYIADYRDDIICFIGGGGPLRSDLQRQIESLELNNRVKLIGYLDHEGENIRHWYNACDLFVLPSLSESFGVVQVEAMACGKPVVATFNGGSEVVIRSEKHGYLTDTGNSRALADTILSALNRDWDETEILEYARQYAWENITEAITDIYSDLLRAHA